MLKPNKSLMNLILFVLSGTIVSCSTPEDTNQGTASFVSEAEAIKKAVVQPLSSGNRAPIIRALSVNPKDQVPKGSPISFTLEAGDEDGDTLKYYWETNKGKLSKKEGLDVFWQTNDQSGISTVDLLVSDGKGGESRGSIKIFIQPDGQAQVKAITKEECGTDASRFVELPIQEATP